MDLNDFVNELERHNYDDKLQDNETKQEEKKWQETVSQEKPVMVSEENTVWEDIANGLQIWNQTIKDAEILRDKTENFRSTVESEVYKQQLDGLLSLSEITEIGYVTGIWVKLLHTISSYNIGCKSLKKDIIGLLVELHSLKQLSRDTLIDCCVKL